MSLFAKIAEEGSEDISTEVLAYFLRNYDSFQPFQKLFFNKVLKEATNSKTLGVEVFVQKKFFKHGQPDLVLTTKNHGIIIENKLFSPLSGEDQLFRYSNIFEDDFFIELNTQNFNKHLVFLAPKYLLASEVEKANKFSISKSGKQFKEFCNEKSIGFIELAWEDLIDDLDTGNILQMELLLYLKTFLPKGLTMEEIASIKNPSVPNGLLKVYNVIEQISLQIKGGGFKKIGRISQSYDQYGFYLSNGLKDEVGYWFGFWLNAWKKYKHPVFFQIITIEGYDLKNSLEKKGFLNKGEDGLLIPFLLDEINDWSSQLNGILSGL